MESKVPIAIVGMSCRFAGEIDSPNKLWQLLAEGRSAWSEILKSRFNIDGVYYPNSEKLNATNVVGGHFLSEDVGLFDAQFFNLSAETAAALDPQFRLQLESTYEAFESAGITLQDVVGSNTSVYAGSFFRDYHESIIKDSESLPRFLLMGTGAAMASNRLSHFYDLRGPSMSLDTGCSTTLTALHQGCQSLRTGESDMSISGGANLILNSDMFLAMSSMTLISKDGKSYAFDSRANGYGRGEGSATLVLKRLDDALRDGNPIRAVIRETSVNQDGKTETITTPSAEAQEALIRACYSRAGLDPSHTTYFEAHGTGTPTGDPIEVGAIASVFKDRRPADEPLRIGSIKTNIGHTETASGVAAIIKVVLALERGQIPPSINFEKPNEKLHLDEWNLKVPTVLEPWAGKDGVRRASINNFGYGGSNAHVIMEDYGSFVSSSLQNSRNEPGLESNGHVNGNTNGYVDGHTNGYTNDHHVNGVDDVDGGTRPRVFILSARDEKAALKMVANLRDYLQTAETATQAGFLDNLAYTLGQRRSLLSWVSTFSGDGVETLAEAISCTKTKPAKAGSAPHLGFVYKGQGAQWWAMGRELIETYPAFKAALLDCDLHLKKLGAKWNMVEELNRDEKTSRVNELDYSTSVCVAVQIALTHLLQAWGVVPTVVTSHSSGEIAAAYAAGALDMASAMAIVYARGGLASDMNWQLARKGGMAAVGSSVEEGRKYLARVTSGQVVVACENSPNSITVSGDLHGLDQLEAALKQDSVFARRLKVDAAWHSHHMDAVAGAYHASMDNKVKPARQRLDVVFSSPSTGERMDSVDEIGSPSHWVRRLTGPVRFVDAFRNMCFDGCSDELQVDMVIEVGPHAALSGPIQDIMSLPRFKGASIPYASCLKGCAVNLAAVNFPHGTHGLKVLHDLPHYPWNHQTRHWIEPRVNKALRNRAEAPHDLLGSLVPGVNLDAPSWRHMVRVNDIPWLADHVVQGNIVYPAAGYIAMAIEGMSRYALRDKGGRQILGYQLRDIDMLNALVVPETSESVEMQLSLRPCSEKAIHVKGCLELEVQSVSQDNRWTDHCRGIISAQYSSADSLGSRWAASTSAESARKGSQHPDESEYRVRVDPRDVYKDLRSGGICHGPAFQNIKYIRSRGRQSVTTFSVADAAAMMPKQHQNEHIVHPTTLDSVSQAAYTAVTGAGNGSATPKVPRSIGTLWVAHDIARKPDHSFNAYSDLVHASDQSMTTAISVVNRPSHQGDETTRTPVITIADFTFQSIGNAPAYSQTAEPWEQDKCSVAKWAPDISFLKEPFLQQQLGHRISASEAQMLLDLRQACVVYMLDALRELDAADVRRLARHYKKFYIWMRLQSELASTDRLAPSSSDANGEMVCALGPRLAAILRGESPSALETMLDGGRLARYYADGLKWARANAQLAELVRHYAHKHPRAARILEIGAGTGGATRHILAGLGTPQSPAACASYDVTDVSSGFFVAAQNAFAP
ncbi:hypothetical protein B0T24DRAFT_684913 [Lasiosphaeria ovina]|uniref:Polyketide synthase n=1 Tax=Lasiosphaeria ovina TaxID=92902 RepID=A0AAE0JTG3_9PEZI|nr:hypothetical protein B0T24DRAFT_684913 [Lasiosphaeria ovina]